MNIERRGWLGNVIAKLDELKDELETIHGDEQAAYNNLPNFLCPSKYMEANIDCLDSCVSDLGHIIENLQEIVDR